MIVLKLKMDGIYGFNDFEIDFSYPKKIVNSLIKDEHLKDRERFRYKKAVILMGTNATGKTTLAKALSKIFDLFQYGYSADIFDMASKDSASFMIDFVNDDYVLRRVECSLSKSKMMSIVRYSSNIGKNDSYEMCEKRLKPITDRPENVKDLFSPSFLNGRLNYHFSFPDNNSSVLEELDQNKLLKSLKAVLGTLDISLSEVSISEDLKNSFIIKREDQEIVIQEGKLLNSEVLSSGTIEGIDIAILLALLMNNRPCFYYCDEHFSYVQSDIEKRIFGIMLDHLTDNSQLIFTTHNTDMLDLNLPKHTYMFLRKKKENGIYRITAVSGSDVLKRNTDSMKSAAENDVFDSLPDERLLDKLEAEWADE